MNTNFSQIFKAYDVRGVYPDEINEESVSRIAEAYVNVRQPKKIAVGQDVRLSGLKLKRALINKLLELGVDVVDIGIITTDQLYFAVGKYGFDGGISVTASHNPGEYNGLKFSEAGGAPIASKDLEAMRDWAISDAKTSSNTNGSLFKQEILGDYVKHVLSYIDKGSIKPFKVLVNANFGAVGRSVDRISHELPLTLEKLNWQEDGSFPKGPPNPLLPENRQETISQIKSQSPDLGVAWDADADRVFFFTARGQFIPSCFIIALLAKKFLAHTPGAKIVHDITTAWVIDGVIEQAGGESIPNRTGHTFIKARMRQEDAVFAGESSGHYYFKDSFYADNGIVPFLLILELMSQSGKSLDELVGPLMQSYFVSGEINFPVKDTAKTLGLLENELGLGAKIDKTDGIAIESTDWRLSLRGSNTEPLIRLNAEARSQDALDALVAKATALIKSV